MQKSCKSNITQKPSCSLICNFGHNVLTQPDTLKGKLSWYEQYGKVLPYVSALLGANYYADCKDVISVSSPQRHQVSEYDLVKKVFTSFTFSARHTDRRLHAMHINPNISLFISFLTAKYKPCDLLM